MEARKFRIASRSISFRVILIISAVMIPLLALLISTNLFATRIVHNQVAESYKAMLSLYMQQIDSDLEEVDNFLSYLQIFNTDLQLMEYSITDLDSYTLAKIRLYNTVSTEMTRYRSLDMILVYASSRQNFLEVTNNSNALAVRESIRNYLIRQASREPAATEDGPFRPWQVERIDGEYYLFRTMKRGDIYLFAVEKAASLLVPLNRINLGERGTSLLITDDGQPMMHEDLVRANSLDLNLDFQKFHLLGDQTRFLIIGDRSSRGNFGLVALIPDDQILNQLPFLQRVITLISFLFIALLPLALLAMRRVTWIPVRRLVRAMKRIEGGDLAYRIDPQPSAEEFQMLNHSFNDMLDQMNTLKIDAYEQKLNRQKAEMERLQLQINPHFFLNSLNIIFTLARSQNYKLIQELTLCLIEYFRFMFRSNLNVVFLRDELKHVRNYIHIQELRFPASLTYTIESPDFLDDTPVPPLILQTFVENTIKHAVTLDRPIHLTVQTSLMEESDGKPILAIHIMDNGQGFAPEILAKLRGDEPIIDAVREHIGIRNLQHRLRLLYDGRARIDFANGEPQGAVVNIRLPMGENK